jgi:seryl-tRNA synthetase
MVADAEQTCAELGLTYRIHQLCTGDMGFTAQITYDIEVWAPGCGEWLEVSSVSNVGDFQARRANVKYRPVDGGRPRFVHTLNGSGLGLPRTLIAVLENYQQADGWWSTRALRPWMVEDNNPPESKVEPWQSTLASDPDSCWWGWLPDHPHLSRLW